MADTTKRNDLMLGRIGAIVLLLWAPAMLGCSRWHSRPSLDYRTIQADPNHDNEKARAENQRAVELLQKGKSDKAEQALQKALIADVTYGPAHNNLGKVYYSQGKFYLAAWEFEYAAKLMPQRAECQNNLGMVYEAVGKLNEAINAYSHAYSMDGKNPIIIGNLARAHVRRGDSDPVVQQLLADLRLYDTRPAWLRWANDRLALGPPPAISPPLQLGNATDSQEAIAPSEGFTEPILTPQPDTESGEELPNWPERIDEPYSTQLRRSDDSMHAKMTSSVHVWSGTE